MTLVQLLSLRSFFWTLFLSSRYTSAILRTSCRSCNPSAMLIKCISSSFSHQCVFLPKTSLCSSSIGNARPVTNTLGLLTMVSNGIINQSVTVSMVGDGSGGILKVYASAEDVMSFEEE
jgi:hypothetical protein